MAAAIKKSVTTARYNDFIYDPLFIVSGAKDHYKAAMIAKISSAKFQICPVFPSMFSDLPHHPRTQLVMRRTESPPEFVYPSTRSSNVDIIGMDRHKFFSSPNIDYKKEEIPVLSLHQNTPIRTARTASTEKSVRKIKKKHRKLQTQYRESSAQTSPWEPDYVVMDDSDPEILKLDFLKWGSGLPAGMHEVRLIERARMKREWEKALPPITDAASLEKRRRVIEAMERDEWAFREQEIQDIHELRLELLEQMLNEIHEKSKCRTEQKIRNFCEIKQAEKEEKLNKLRHNAEREMRKLEMKHRGVNRKYHKVNIVEEYADRKSELYGPQMRHGEHPKRWHQIIDERLKKYRAQFIGIEHISTLPRWLDRATKMKDCCCVKLPGTRLCMRETKWTTPVLKQLHEELKTLRKPTKRACSLRVKIGRKESEIETPEVEGITESDEDIYQASVLIESVLRGRASQVLIYEGRDRCRELIQELRSTHALQEAERLKRYEERVEVKSQQRDENVCLRNAFRLQESLNRLQGKVIGSLLDFLNKELRRLLDERRAHALCLLAERERQNREAAEAGRRQTELRRRAEHDEMFKQIVKVHQDTIDLYLQDIVTEGMEFTSSDEATDYIQKLAEKIDKEAYDTLTNTQSFNDDEEMVADLVHHFVLPEVEKQLVRDRMKLRQKKYLKTAHNSIYNKVEKLQKPLPAPIKSKKKKKKKVGDEIEFSRLMFDNQEQLQFSTSLLDQSTSVQASLRDNLRLLGDSEDDSNRINILYHTSNVDVADDTQSYQFSVMDALNDDKLSGTQETNLEIKDSEASTSIPLKRKSSDLELPMVTGSLISEDITEGSSIPSKTAEKSDSIKTNLEFSKVDTGDNVKEDKPHVKIIEDPPKLDD